MAFGTERALLVSAIEHDSVLQPAQAHGAQTFGANKDGVSDLGALEDLLERADRPALVSLMLVNNETGVIQPVPEAAALCRRHGALLHCTVL